MSKKITIEDLAGMVKRGFDDTHAYMNRRFDDMDKRFDRIENLILKRHEEEIEQLKIRVKELEDLFAMPIKK